MAALVHGSGYERIASPGCSDRTIRRRGKAWAQDGVAETLHTLVLQQYDRLIGLECADLSLGGGITKAPCGGAQAGRSPVDRGTQGRKRSTVTDAPGVPVHLVCAGATCHDSPLLQPTLDGLDTLAPLPAGGTAHRDRASDSTKTRALLDTRGLLAAIARTGIAAPLQVGRRWVVERTNAWMNDFGTLRRWTERNGTVVDF